MGEEDIKVNKIVCEYAEDCGLYKSDGICTNGSYKRCVEYKRKKTGGVTFL